MQRIIQSRRAVLMWMFVLRLAKSLSPKRAAAQTSPTQRVTFGFWGDQRAFENYRAIADVFQAINPGVAIELVHTPETRREHPDAHVEDFANADDEYQSVADEDYLTWLATSFAEGTPPDAFLIGYRRFGQYAASGQLSPVGPRLQHSPTLRVEDYFEQSVEAFTSRGALQCLPQDVSPHVVYVNRTLFREAGVSLPQDDWTWDDLLSTATSLTKDLDGDGVPDQFGFGFDPDLQHFAPFIWQAGGDIVDDANRPTKMMFDDPVARTGIQFFLDLQQIHRVAPGEDFGSQVHLKHFLSNRLAMFVADRSVVPALRGAVGFTWDVVPLPIGPATAATMLESNGLCLAESSDVKDAAWAFAEFAAGFDGQQQLVKSGGMMPSLRALAESETFLGQASSSTNDSGDPSTLPTRNDVYVAAMATARRVPTISTWSDIERGFETPFRRAYYAEMPIDAAIGEVHRRSASAFAEASTIGS